MSNCMPRGAAPSSAAVRALIPRNAIALLSEGRRPAKSRLEVAVLFVDIEGCTRLCEDLPAREMNAVTERYFSAYLDEIRSAGGEVTEVLGDGLLALFEAGGRQACVRSALAAAAGIQQSTRRLNARPGKRHDEIRVNMGLNAGAARVGFTRLRGRCGERWVYAATGPVANVAARLLGLATGGQIFVTRAVADLLVPGFTCSSLGPRALKNVSAPVEVISIDAALPSR